MTRTVTLVALISVIACSEARAQDPGDPTRGLSYAKKVCAECHGVEAIDDQSPHGAAPTFKAIVNAKGMTGTALAVWLHSPHPTMPEIIVPNADRNDLIAYILSLGKMP